jgi:guanylate kinase
MLLLRLSGHSCAGKTRLVNALRQFGVTCPKVTRYTSRKARPEEIHGQDYYFHSREFIEALPEKDFLVGPVRNMLQAFDLNQLEKDLKANDLVLIEIYPALWQKLLERLSERLGPGLITASVFMTAVDPEKVKSFREDEEKAGYITSEVYKMLLSRNKDEIEDIKIRAHAAAGEILEALSPAGRKMYAKIIHSAPEGPDGEDDWTKDKEPAGQAKGALEEFIALISSLKPAILPG